MLPGMTRKGPGAAHKFYGSGRAHNNFNIVEKPLPKLERAGRPMNTRLSADSVVALMGISPA
jgi:hypothetical protein